MAIPAIQPYQMPTAADMPQNKVSWVPAPNRAVLLIHDMQNYFVDAFTAGASPVTELSANIRRLKDQCVQLGIPVVYTAQPGSQNPADRALLTDFWGPGLSSGPYKEKIITELAPDDNDLVLTKWRYSAFKRTNLLEMMRKEGRDQLIITGIYAHIGCLVTACEAFMEDIEAFFVGDAVADFSLEKHQMALDYAAGRCAYTVMTDSLLDQLKNAPAYTRKTALNTRKEMFTCEKIRKQIAELLQDKPEDITNQEDLLDRGLDSVRIMTLVEQWRREGAEVTFVELAERPTIEEWQKLLATRSQQVLPNADYL